MSREIVARGRSLGEAFVGTVLNLFSFAVDPATVEPREVRETRAHGGSPEALLAHWIGECVYVHEVEGFVCHTIDLAVFDPDPQVSGEPLRLYAFLRGEEMDPARHRSRGTVALVSPGNITISPIADGYEIRLTVGN